MSAAEIIFLSPEDAELFDNKYGHPKIGFGPCVGDPYVKYIRADLVPQWQPIETAPRDGTFLALNYDGIVHQATMTKHGPYSVTSKSFMSATHWMPLPTPPTA